MVTKTDASNGPNEVHPPTNWQKRRYAWAKRVDPDAVKKFEAAAEKKRVRP